MCHSQWAFLIFILAVSKSMLCAIFRPIDELQDLCQKILQGHNVKEHPEDMLLLQNKCPFLFDLLAEIGKPTLLSKMQVYPSPPKHEFRCLVSVWLNRYKVTLGNSSRTLKWSHISIQNVCCVSHLLCNLI